jgi:hypothetical protein
MPKTTKQRGKPCIYYALPLSPAEAYATRRTLEMMASSSGGRLRRISLISSSSRMALSSSVRLCWSFKSCAFGGGKARCGDIVSADS